jgi:hypothetical protein
MGGGWHGWGAATSGCCTVELGSGALGQCHVGVLHQGLAVVSGLHSMDKGVGGHWHLPCVGWILLVVGAGVG